MIASIHAELRRQEKKNKERKAWALHFLNYAMNIKILLREILQKQTEITDEKSQKVAILQVRYLENLLKIAKIHHSDPKLLI